MIQLNRLEDKISLVDRKLISQILGSYFSTVSTFNFSVIGQGQENLSYKITVGKDKYVLRIYNDMQFGKYRRIKEEISQELQFMDMCTQNGLPVPRIVRNNQGKLFSSVKIKNDEHFFALFSFAFGKEVKIFNTEKIINVAKLQSKMHKLSENYPLPDRRINGHLGHQAWQRRELEDFVNTEDEKVFNQYKEFGSKISKIIDSPKVNMLQKLFIHSDMHEGNMRFLENKINGVFDFDDARVSIVSEDIGMFFSVILKSGDIIAKKKKAEVYFYEYEKIRKLTNYEKYLSLIYAVEKRLVYKTISLKDEISNCNTDFKSYFLALKSMKIIYKISDRYK